MSRKPLCRLAAVALGLVALQAQSSGIEDPATYVQVDLAARSLTLDGLRERLKLLKAGGRDPAVHQALDDASHKAISELFHRHGTTAAAHAAYGTRRAAEIRAWLEAHPEPARRYAELESELRDLSKQLSELR